MCTWHRPLRWIVAVATPREGHLQKAESMQILPVHPRFWCEVKTLRLPCKAFGWSIRFLIGHLCSCSFQDLGWHRLKSESMKSHRRRCLCMSHCHQVMMLLFTIFCHLAVLGDSRVKHSQGSTEMDDFHEWYWFADDSLMSLSAFLMRFLTSRGTATPKIFGPLISILVWIRWFFSKNLKISYDTWTYIYIYDVWEICCFVLSTHFPRISGVV